MQGLGENSSAGDESTRQAERGPSRRRCALVDAGRVDYLLGLALQARARSLVETEGWDGLLLLVEHPAVITVGRNGGRENLLLDERRLVSRGVQLVASERGGNITCHNPGQLVGYPVLNLRKWRQDVHWYVRRLEDVLIGTLASCGLQGGRKPGYPGVWVGDKKIAALGVLIRCWITGHGFALNIENDLDVFKWIVPCGIREYGVTSINECGRDTGMGEVKRVLAERFSRTFECELLEIPEIREAV